MQRLHEKVEASLGPWISGSDLVHAVQRWNAGSFAADVESEFFVWQACIKMWSVNVLSGRLGQVRREAEASEGSMCQHGLG